MRKTYETPAVEVLSLAAEENVMVGGENGIESNQYGNNPLSDLSE